ncbi:IQ motif and S7 domain-containing protein 1 [Dermatophagoides pteronyssinus]|uniref:IQ motif and S7 domain-containing protein 1 n=1 Tax=Dermatophagoides pteronyssinus TaxID=6956 RepID=A0ABQ8JS23_DERPT|nr:IQ motif and S7 domain-containing protein 1 [Dermatophagoides pteronyssinus]
MDQQQQQQQQFEQQQQQQSSSFDLEFNNCSGDSTTSTIIMNEQNDDGCDDNDNDNDKHSLTVDNNNLDDIETTSSSTTTDQDEQQQQQQPNQQSLIIDTLTTTTTTPTITTTTTNQNDQQQSMMMVNPKISSSNQSQQQQQQSKWPPKRLQKQHSYHVTTSSTTNDPSSTIIQRLLDKIENLESDLNRIKQERDQLYSENERLCFHLQMINEADKHQQRQVNLTNQISNTQLVINPNNNNPNHHNDNPNQMMMIRAATTKTNFACSSSSSLSNVRRNSSKIIAINDNDNLNCCHQLNNNNKDNLISKQQQQNYFPNDDDQTILTIAKPILISNDTMDSNNQQQQQQQQFFYQQKSNLSSPTIIGMVNVTTPTTTTTTTNLIRTQRIAGGSQTSLSSNHSQINIGSGCSQNINDNNNKLSTTSTSSSQYELSQQLLDKKVSALERKYGGLCAREAAIKIQRSYRSYRLQKQQARSVAIFLLTRKGVSKQMIGEYLADNNQFNKLVLKAFIAEINLNGLIVDEALRSFQMNFRFPGEAQKIERLVESFADRYKECNPNDVLSRDSIFILAFAIIMLNTDLHKPTNIKHRMTQEQWLSNLKGVFSEGDLSSQFLLGIYKRIKKQELQTGPDHVTQVLKVQSTIVGKDVPNLCLPHRRLVCYCRLYEIRDVNRKEKVGQHQRDVFLFNDLLLITKTTNRSRNNQLAEYQYRSSTSLDGLQVNIFAKGFYAHGIRISRRVDQKCLALFNARNELDQRRFVEDLRESIAEMDEMEQIRITKSSSLVQLNDFMLTTTSNNHNTMVPVSPSINGNGNDGQYNNCNRKQSISISSSSNLHSSNDNLGNLTTTSGTSICGTITDNDNNDYHHESSIGSNGHSLIQQQQQQHYYHHS